MGRPRISTAPLTAAERAQRSRDARANELQQLRDENARLRNLLDDHGVEYETASVTDAAALAERAGSIPAPTISHAALLSSDDHDEKKAHVRAE